jgi:transcriptional regulator NrdR family protein
MRCPYCERYDSKVLNTVNDTENFAVWRKNKCKDPEEPDVFFTVEIECTEAEYIKARERVALGHCQARSERRKAHGNP